MYLLDAHLQLFVLFLYYAHFVGVDSGLILELMTAVSLEHLLMLRGRGVYPTQEQRVLIVFLDHIEGPR